MKRFNYLVWLTAIMVVAVSCNKVSYKKTKSGLMYKMYPSGSKDSVLKAGNVVKFQVKATLNDSVLYTSYGKMPAYWPVNPTPVADYSIIELLPLMKTGDSAVAIQLVDTLLSKGSQLPQGAKRGDRIITTFRILEVFRVDSIARADYEREMEKDRPRAMKEQEADNAKRKAEMDKMIEAEYNELEKSGEIAKEFKEMDAMLAAKNIKTTKTGRGTYVEIKDKGTGAQVQKGKFLTIKYHGKMIDNDSTFEQGTYPFQLGVNPVIAGWEEGLLLFQQGGKGTLYIPGFLAYGKTPNPGSPFQPFEALKFDIEVLSVSDTAPAQPRPVR